MSDCHRILDEDLRLSSFRTSIEGCLLQLTMYIFNITKERTRLHTRTQAGSSRLTWQTLLAWQQLRHECAL